MAKEKNTTDKIHGSENARCLRSYIKTRGINPRASVTFADLIAIEDDYEAKGAPDAESDK